MKKNPIFLACVVAFGFIVFAQCVMAAPPPAKAAETAKAKALTPAELKRKQNEIRAKADHALWQLRDTCRNQKKEFAKIQPLVEEYLAFLKIPENEGRPDSITPSAVHRRIASALSRPVNLRLVPQVEKHLAEATKLAKTDEEKLLAAYETARFMILAARDEKPEDHRKVLLATYENKALPASTRLDLLKQDMGVILLPGVDFVEAGWKVVKDEPRLHGSYYYQALRTIVSGSWKTENKLDARYSPERIVEVCDKALADPAVTGKSYYLGEKADALVSMRRPDLAEQLLLEAAATTNASVRYDYEMALGKFYTKSAERYYDDPDPTCLKKAMTAYAAASLARPKSTAPLYRMAELHLQLDEPDRAITGYESIIPLERGQTNLSTAVGLGDAYFAKKDWEMATRYYGLYPDRLRKEALLRYCRSLYILERYEETAKWLEAYGKQSWGGAKDEARFFLESVRKHLPPADEGK